MACRSRSTPLRTRPGAARPDHRTRARTPTAQPHHGGRRRGCRAGHRDRGADLVEPHEQRRRARPSADALPGPTATSTSPPTRTSPGPPQAAPRPVEAPGWESLAATERVWLREFIGTADEAQARQVYRAARVRGPPADARAAARHGHGPDRSQRECRGGAGPDALRKLSRRRPRPGAAPGRCREQPVPLGGRDERTGRQHRRLTLTYLDGAGPTQFGAPADVLLRLLLTSAPFTYHQGP